MKPAPRSAVAFLLSTLLVLTAQSMAVVRGATAATGQMVICSGYETKVVYLDAQGVPTAGPHVCPDCLISFGESCPSDQPGSTAHLDAVSSPSLTKRQPHPEELENVSFPRGPPVAF